MSIDDWDIIVGNIFEYYNKKQNYSDEKWQQACEYMYAVKRCKKNNSSDLLEVLIEDISHSSLYREYNKNNKDNSLSSKK